MEDEIWKDVRGFLKYEISSLGRVINIRTKKILKPQIGKHGYYQVCLHRDDSGTLNKRIHRLVIENFKEPIVGKECCNHIDGNKLNNNLDNLEWSSPLENSSHASRIGLYREGDKHGKTNISDGKIISILFMIRTRELCYRQIKEMFGPSADQVVSFVINEGGRESIVSKFFSKEDLIGLRAKIIANGVKHKINPYAELRKAKLINN